MKEKMEKMEKRAGRKKASGRGYAKDPAIWKLDKGGKDESKKATREV